MMLYKPLNRNDIRLLTILPSDDPKAQIECLLTHHDITGDAYTSHYTKTINQATPTSERLGNQGDLAQSAKVGSSSGDASSTTPSTSHLSPFRYVWGDYMALSYTWGDPTVTCPIILNGFIVQVTLNLHYALKALRKRPYIQAGWKIWIDALCINQKDNSERSTEVKRMGTIYKKAWTPIIWVGTAEEGGDAASDLIARLAPDCEAQDEVLRLNHMLKNNPRAFGTGSWRALHDYMTRQYWRRAWIVQEASLGKHNTPVICGDREICFRDIYRLFKFLGRSDEILNVYMHGEVNEVGRTINQDIHTSIGVVAKIGEYQRQIEFGRYLPNVFNAIRISRQVAATDPRDKIYGMLAFMPDELTRRIKPDYDASIADVYTTFALLSIDVTNSLEILRQISPARDGGLPLPSWVPDFTTPQLLCSLGNDPHQASGNASLEVSYPKPGVISVRGFVFDTIDGLGCVWAGGWPASSCYPAVGMANPYGSFEGAREAIWKTMCANRNVYTRTLRDDYSCLLAMPAIYKARGCLGVENLEDLASSHVFSYCMRAFAGNSEFKVAGEKLDSYFDTGPDFEALARELPVLRDALNARDKVNLYRRMFTTSMGFVGIGMQEIVRSDMVCILFGCSMPIILRQVDGHWVILGECYVHGLMEGGGLDLLPTQGAIPQDFEIW